MTFQSTLKSGACRPIAEVSLKFAHRYQQSAVYSCTAIKMADRESVLLEVINTKHKKSGGSLRLLSNKLIWIPYGSESPKLSCAYSEIKGNDVA